MAFRYMLGAGLALALAACGTVGPQPQTVSPAITAAPPATAAPATAVPPATAAPATAAPAGAPGAELLFLRGGTLIALSLGTRAERRLADKVLDFAATPGGDLIALVRDLGKSGDDAGHDLWLIGRNGTGLRRLTTNGFERIEATPAWSPEGQALAYASADTSDPYGRSWMEWSAWCAASEIHVLDLASGADQSFGGGCDPAISPDGKRIAYATPPSVRYEGANAPNAGNSIRLINRQGQNGWNFAQASAAPDAPAARRGLLVYAPAWSPDGKQLVYHRFLGYQALVDISMSEIGGSLEGQGRPLSSGAGWQLPARFAPDSRTLAIVENNFSDARGFGGYDDWSAVAIRLEGTRELALPEGPISAVGQLAGDLPRVQAAAWAPGGQTLAVLLPPGWSPTAAQNEPYGHAGEPGEIWRWQPGQPPAERLAEQVDFASPLVWLP